MKSTVRTKTPAIACVFLCTAGIAAAQDRSDSPARSALTQVGPRLELSESEWDFGTVWQHTPLEHHVSLTNTGDAPLRITGVKPSCGCTASKLERDTIEPGASVPMTVKYNAQRRRQKVGTTVRITSNDPAQPVMTYRIKGEVKPCYVMKPETGLVFSTTRAAPESTRTVTIENTFDKKMYLKLEDAGGDAFDVSLRTIEPGEKYELIATARPSPGLGSTNTVAILTTDLTQVPEIRIPIRSIVIPRVRVSPTTLTVPKASPKPSARILRVTSLAGHPVTVLGVKSAHQGIKTEILSPTPASAHGYATQQIRVVLPPGADLPDHTTLEILTDAEEPEFAEIEVRISTNALPSTARSTSGDASSAQPPREAPATRSHTSAHPDAKSSER